MSSTLNTNNGAALTRRAPALLYPTLLIAGIAVIIVSMLGTAAMAGVLSRAQSQPLDERAAGGKDAKSGSSAKTAQAKTAGSKTALLTVACTDCGMVDSVRAVEVKDEGSGLDVVAGGVLGNQVGGGRGRTAMTVVGAGAGAYAGNEVEKNMKKKVSYQIRVRMDDNSYRTFHSAQPDVGIGQRVKVRDGQLVGAG